MNKENLMELASQSQILFEKLKQAGLISHRNYFSWLKIDDEGGLYLYNWEDDDLHINLEDLESDESMEKYVSNKLKEIESQREVARVQEEVRIMKYEKEQYLKLKEKYEE